jgi:hypothetical protein
MNKKGINFWFRYALKFYEQNDPANLERPLLLLSQLLMSMN